MYDIGKEMDQGRYRGHLLIFLIGKHEISEQQQAVLWQQRTVLWQPRGIPSKQWISHQGKS